MNKSIREIVKEEAESEKLQHDWDRQLNAAEKIVKQHEDGFGTILLADEVGMGKTYVALIVMAYHLLSKNINSSRVLLIVPPNNVLARKWEQEIRTFGETYLSKKQSLSSNLRPLVVSDHLDLIQNLHMYQNQKTPRVSEGMLQCLAFATNQWNKQRKKKERYREWEIYGKINQYDIEYLNFCSWFSPLAICDFLDEEFSNNQKAMQEMLDYFNQNQSGGLHLDYLKSLLKRFGQKQKKYEANIFVINMSKLRRSDKGEYRLLNSYIASIILLGYRENTKKACLKNLSKWDLCLVPYSGMAPAGNPHLRWFSSLSTINLWGMKEAVHRVLAIKGGKDSIKSQLLLGDQDSVERLMTELRDEAIKEKLNQSNIKLAVVDEVHNWKSGNNGAKQFENIYSGCIPNKLIMSATPFQIEKSELGNVFKYSSGGDESFDIVKRVLVPNGLAENCLKVSDEFYNAWKKLGFSDCEELSLSIDSCENTESIIEALKINASNSECLNDFLNCVTKYKKLIEELQIEFSRIMIRHTKGRDKRHFHSGRDYSVGKLDYTKIHPVLYEISGFGNESEALLSFLAMRLDQLIRRDLHSEKYQINAHLIGGITSSNGAFKESNGKLFNTTSISEESRRYANFFSKVLSKYPHPKVAATISRGVYNYRRGFKTLIFCERLKTQEEITAGLTEEISQIAFPDGGLERSKTNREAILKNHKVVELFWSRSYLSTRSDEDRIKLSGALRSGADKILTNVANKSRALDASLNQRQFYKLFDLFALHFLMKAGSEDLFLTFEEFINGESCSAALRQYLRIKVDKDFLAIDEGIQEDDSSNSNLEDDVLEEILNGQSIWHPLKSSGDFHIALWKLLNSEVDQLIDVNKEYKCLIFSQILLDLGQGLRKVLLRLDRIYEAEKINKESIALAVVRLLESDYSNNEDRSSWKSAYSYLQILLESDGSIRRNAKRSSKRQSSWKGVFLRDESIVSEMKGETAEDTRVNLCAAFNSPLLPDILVCTAIGSEGIDLQRNCADVIHHDLPWNPAKLEQRIGRIDRVGSLVEQKYNPHSFRLNIGIPFLAHNYDRFQYHQLLQRAQKFEVLLGRPDFSVDVEEVVEDHGGKEVVREVDGNVNIDSDELLALPSWLIDYLVMDLSVKKS